MSRRVVVSAIKKNELGQWIKCDGGKSTENRELYL